MDGSGLLSRRRGAPFWDLRRRFEFGWLGGGRDFGFAVVDRCRQRMISHRRLPMLSLYRSCRLVRRARGSLFRDRGLRPDAARSTVELTRLTVMLFTIVCE